MFDKVDGFIRDYNETEYLILFGPKKYDAIFNLIGLESGITYVYSHNYAKIKTDSNYYFPLKKY